MQYRTGLSSWYQNFCDKLTGTSTREQRPGLSALLDYARPGDTIVVVGIDRLRRNAAEVHDHDA